MRFHRCPVRAVGPMMLAAVLTALLVSSCGERDVSDDESVESDQPNFRRADIRAELGLDGVNDSRVFNELRVYVRNSGGGHFNGSLRVNGVVPDPEGRGDMRRSRLTYSRALEVPFGETRVVSLPVRPEDWQAVDIRLSQGRDTWRARVYPSLASRYRSRILVIADPIAGFDPGVQFRPVADWMEKTFFEGPDVNVVEVNPLVAPAQMPVAVVPPESKVKVATVLSTKLPATRAAYEPFDLVVLSGSSLVEADSAMRTALHEWVRSGGTLIAFPGPSWMGGLPAELKELLHVSMDGAAKPVPPSRELQIYTSLSDRDVQKKLVSGPGGELVENGLAIFAREGAGQVLTFRFMPKRVFPLPSEAVYVYDVLRKTMHRALSFSGRSGFALHELERVVPAVLFGMSGFRIPPVSKVAWGLAVYLVIGFFVPAFFFKRIGRREWTFLVVVVCAGLSTLGIYRYGLLSSVGGRELEELSVLRVHADGRAAEATSLLGVIGPTLDRLELDGLARAGEVGPGAGGTMAVQGGVRPQPLRGQVPSGQYGPRSVISLPIPSILVKERSKDDFALGAFTLYPNAMRYFRFDYRLDLEASPSMVRVLPESTQTMLRVSVSNPFESDMKLYLVRDGAFLPVSNPVSGETERTVSISLVPAGAWDRNLGLPNHSRNRLFGSYSHWIDDGSTQNSGASLPRDPFRAAAVLYAIRSVVQPGRPIFRNNFGMPTATRKSPSVQAQPSQREKPAFLLAHVPEPIFPLLRGADGVRRKGNTVLVFELPLSIYN